MKKHKPHLGHLIVSFFNWLNDLFHIHKWYHGTFSLGVRSKYTGDFIGRSERQCTNCDKKQLSIGQLSVANKEKIYKAYGKKQYYPYKTGDALDLLTREILTKNNAVDYKPSAAALSDYFNHIGDGSQILKF